MVEAICTSTKCNGGHVVQGATSSMWLRVDRRSVLTKFKESFDQNSCFTIKDWGVAVNSGLVEPAVRDTAVFAPRIRLV